MTGAHGKVWQLAFGFISCCLINMNLLGSLLTVCETEPSSGILASVNLLVIVALVLPEANDSLR